MGLMPCSFISQIVTTIASVADTVEKDFIPYYDRFMPCLKYIIEHGQSEELRMLRGKTIECVSLIGLSVGRDVFLNDANAVMELLLKTHTEGKTTMTKSDEFSPKNTIN